jgi:DNA-binding transcriptional ArsR family regulator
VLELGLPAVEERITILNKELGDFLGKRDGIFIPAIAELLSNKSPADLCKLAEGVKRRVVLRDENISQAILHSVEIYTKDKETKGKFCVLAKQMLGDEITVRQLGEITGLSPAGVQYHLTKHG